jgi:uncharacterized protein YceH (UPF0502 family)
MDATPAWGASPPGAAPPAVQPAPPAATPAPADPRVAELETRVAQLRRDVDDIASFARTLLALLEEKQVVTEQQFAETKRRLDAAAPPKT